MSDPITILHHDDHVLAVDKPAGMTVHRDDFSGRHERFVLQTVARQVDQYLYPVHRLDRNTSGVLCFALSSDAARELQANLGAKDAEKVYLVLARGETPESFESDRPLRNKHGDPTPAFTSFRRLATFSRCSLLETRITTGRHHQIRRHLNHLGHHVIGDTTHGKGDINRYFRREYGLPRLCIHAVRVECRHPDAAAASLTVRAPLAADFRAFLGRLPDVPEGLIAAW